LEKSLLKLKRVKRGVFLPCPSDFRVFFEMSEEFSFFLPPEHHGQHGQHDQEGQNDGGRVTDEDKVRPMFCP
jgi:hypothetical protein